MPASLRLVFDQMNFFELQEDDVTTVYCYEQENSPHYLIASNELGETPTPDKSIIIACYDTATDVFLWQREFADIEEIHSFFQQDSLHFIQLLEKKAL